MNNLDKTTADLDTAMMSILVENNAQTIYDHLDHLEKQQEIYAKRWFWELLQNAKDAVDVKNNERVSIKVILENNKLTFSHTGNPFNQDDVLHLISHGSSKKKLEGKTGRFGTGFMTTHLLSRKVTISGTLDNNQSFSFALSREASNVQQQKDNLDLSYLNFKNSLRIEPYHPQPYSTIFEYELIDKKNEIARAGIEQLQHILPFVLAFNSEIDKIEVWDNGNLISISRGKCSKRSENDCIINEQEITLDTKNLTVVTLSNKDSTIAVLVDTSKYRWEIVHLDEKYSKLFFDFPLLGTEKLGCPFIINSTKFDLRGERDGIYLGIEDKPSITENKRIFSDALLNIPILIKYLSNKNIIGLYHLFKIQEPLQYEWLHKEWVEGKFKGLVQLLLEVECTLIAGKSIKLNNITVPYPDLANKKSFYDLASSLFLNTIPPFIETDSWITVAEGFSSIEKKNIKEYKFIFNEKKLCERVEDFQTLHNLSSHLKVKSEIVETPISWLNNLFELLSKDQIETLTSHYAIILNQSDSFIKRTSTTPSFDAILNEPLKEVIELFGWKLRKELIHPELKALKGIFPHLTLERAIQQVSTLAEKISVTELKINSNRIALISLFKWFINNKQFDEARKAAVIVESGKDAGEPIFQKRPLFLSSNDKLICPFPIWEKKFSLYKELVKTRYVLIDEYAAYLPPDDFKLLAEHGFIYDSPLIKRSNATKQELKILLRREEDLHKLPVDKDEFSLEFSDIPYLTRGDDGILNKTGESIKSAKTLLKFILTQVLLEDDSFYQSIDCTIGDNKISMSKSLWLSRLKTTQWVPIKSGEEDGGYASERPSTSSLTDLVKDDELLLNKIKDKTAALFFSQLGLSVADIIRNTLDNEAEKLAWDLTFSHLLTGNKIKPDLAIEMLQDPNLQQVYTEQKAKRDTIKRNQDIGLLFEKVFKSIFASEKYKADGFTIDRTAIGSDFGVVYEQDFLDENGKEIAFKIDQILIELKASGKDFAEMTPTQAEEATKNPENYVLAVLPLSGYEINEDTVRKHSRFIVDIAKPLRTRYDKFISYSQEKQNAVQNHEGINLSIEDGKIRYQVKSEVWLSQTALEFEPFVSWIKSKMTRKLSNHETISNHAQSHKPS